MNKNKKEYESPKVEKMEFDFINHVVASGYIPGHPRPEDLDEDGNPIIDSDRGVYSPEGACYYYRSNEGCYD